jgi:hypothetical protein
MEPKMCPIHNVMMEWRDRQDGSGGWHSHQTTDQTYPAAKNGNRYCTGKPPKQAQPQNKMPGPSMQDTRLAIMKACYVPGMGVDWNQVSKMQNYVVNGVIPVTEDDPFPPEAA